MAAYRLIILQAGQGSVKKLDRKEKENFVMYYYQIRNGTPPINNQDPLNSLLFKIPASAGMTSWALGQ